MAQLVELGGRHFALQHSGHGDPRRRPRRRRAAPGPGRDPARTRRRLVLPARTQLVEPLRLAAAERAAAARPQPAPGSSPPTTPPSTTRPGTTPRRSPRCRAPTAGPCCSARWAWTRPGSPPTTTPSPAGTPPPAPTGSSPTAPRRRCSRAYTDQLAAALRRRHPPRRATSGAAGTPTTRTSPRPSWPRTSPTSPGLPFDVVQIDDGWEELVGDWQPNAKFPSGMRGLADRITDAGFTPGLWLAPFIALPHSRLATERPELLLRDAPASRSSPATTGAARTTRSTSPAPTPASTSPSSIQRVVHDWGFRTSSSTSSTPAAAPLRGPAARADLPRRPAAHPRDRRRRRVPARLRRDPAAVPGPARRPAHRPRRRPDVGQLRLRRPVRRHRPQRRGQQRAPAVAVPARRGRPGRHLLPQQAQPADRPSSCSGCATSPTCAASGPSPTRRAGCPPPSWRTCASTSSATPVVRRLSRYRFTVDGRDVDFAPAVATDGQLYPIS